MASEATAPRRLTSADVAKEAGVSRSTVSFVLNNAPNQSIPEITRQRVLDAVERLGYSPSAAARTLAMGRSDVVVYLMPDLPFNATVGTFLERLSTALASKGLTLLIRPWANAAQPVTDLLGAVSPVAILVPDPLKPSIVKALRSAGVRAVTTIVDHEYFLESQREIGRIQARTLIDAGYTMLAGALSDDPRVTTAATLRFEGVREVCAERGLPVPLSAVVPLDPKTAAETIRAWRATSPSVTGVCAYDDDTALALLAGMHELRLSAPADVALIGVDDAPGGRLSTPGLTTVVVDQFALADNAADAVARDIKHEPKRKHPLAATIRLIRRGTA